MRARQAGDGCDEMTLERTCHLLQSASEGIRSSELPCLEEGEVPTT